MEGLAVLRLDGDLYASTIVVLRSLYYKARRGGSRVREGPGSPSGGRAAPPARGDAPPPREGEAAARRAAATRGVLAGMAGPGERASRRTLGCPAGSRRARVR
jgi:hypothetical protein